MNLSTFITITLIRNLPAVLIENLQGDFTFGLFFWQLFMLIAFVLAGYCFVLVFRSNLRFQQKLAWILALFLLPFLGAILYLISRKGRNK